MGAQESKTGLLPHRSAAQPAGREPKTIPRSMRETTQDASSVDSGRGGPRRPPPRSSPTPGHRQCLLLIRSRVGDGHPRQDPTATHASPAAIGVANSKNEAGGQFGPNDKTLFISGTFLLVLSTKLSCGSSKGQEIGETSKLASPKSKTTLPHRS